MASGAAVAITDAERSLADELRTQAERGAAHAGITVEFVVAAGNPFTELEAASSVGWRSARTAPARRRS